MEYKERSVFAKLCFECDLNLRSSIAYDARVKRITNIPCKTNV